MKKAPTRVFSWFKAPTSSFTFKTIKLTIKYNIKKYFSVYTFIHIQFSATIE